MFAANHTSLINLLVQSLKHSLLLSVWSADEKRPSLSSKLSGISRDWKSSISLWPTDSVKLQNDIYLLFNRAVIEQEIYSDWHARITSLENLSGIINSPWLCHEIYHLYFHLSHKLYFCIIYDNIAWSNIPQHFSKMIRISVGDL